MTIKSGDNIYRTLPGKPLPIGATWDGRGVNFSIFTDNAETVELCLFNGDKETGRIIMPEQTDHIWHVYIPGIKPGQLYGYRVYGQYDPHEGKRFNPNKLLLDPYAKAISGNFTWDNSLLGYKSEPRVNDFRPNGSDSSGNVARSVVVDESYDWEGVRKPRIEWHNTVIYELHTKGFTAINEKIPENLRGTYTGLSHPEIIRYLKSLNITTVELLPVHHSFTEKHLADNNLTNYWGYSSIGYFAPDSRFSSNGDTGGQITEFKSMVKAFHREGIEIIIDVVYNHTAEGNRTGPTLSFRGIDNSSYYWLKHNSMQHYMDYTGCGNTINVRHPKVLQLIMDSLRYWAEVMQVDGFRFDLAAALGRRQDEFDKFGEFFSIISQDPVLSGVKLIAEPWDLGKRGYQLGNFPTPWSEWNGKYRDCVRKFWRGDQGMLAELATRISGSSDIFHGNGKRPYSSINFVTCHDGFTLHDLVTYSNKHNEDNKEDNNDGSDNNHSYNHGVEGETDRSDINEIRERLKRNFIATLLLSQGVPMLLAGDELSRTQSGNNNAYCQDNEISWINWDIRENQKNLLKFTRFLLDLTKEHPVFRRRYYLIGETFNGSKTKDIAWFSPSGNEKNISDWHNPEHRCFGFRLSGDSINEPDEEGNKIIDDTFLILMNGHNYDKNFTLPERHNPDSTWQLILDTIKPDVNIKHDIPEGLKTYKLNSRSIALLKLKINGRNEN